MLHNISKEKQREIINSIENEKNLNIIADFFKVFGDATRLKILMALHKEEMCVNDLSLCTNINQSNLSHQLKLLRTQKLVKKRKHGKNVFYSLDDEHILQILNIGIAHTKEK